MEMTYHLARTPGYTERLHVRANGSLVTTIHVDRTHFAQEWCRNHGMWPTTTITTDNGEHFTLWEDGERACAIPATEGGNA